MAKSRTWSSPARHGLGLFMLLIVAVFLLANPVSAKALAATDGQIGAPDYTCSETKKCALGCCGKNGVCGMGPDYCSAENCVNSCDAKSECDPANWGPQYAAHTTCPLNVCCSKFGFCGTTEEFCGDTQIANPSCPGGTSANRRTIGYYEGWGIGRACDAMLPEQIPAAAYTHINFAFAMIDPVTFAVAPMSTADVDLYSRVTGLKTIYPNLKVWISIGGWSMNDPDQPTATTFSDLAASTANQQKFFASLISFMSQYGFDGVDVDWEYPVAEERSGRPEDYDNYPVFLRNLKNAFQAAGKSWGVTITMPSSFWYLQHFDIVKLEPVVDWFNMMEYDIHGTWDSTSVWTGAYVAAHTNLTEIDQSMKLLWRNNIDPAKVVLGLGFYGRSYTLADPSCNTPGCPFTAGAPGGPCTNSVGTLSYGEIQQIIQDGATPVLDSEAAVQMLTYNGNNWVSYDDEVTLKMKVDYANNNCLGGTMVWAASTDDAKGSAAKALREASGGGELPLNVQVGLVIPSDNPGLCSWTKCGGSCPAGTSMAAYVLDGCPQPTSSPFNYRLFCCPSNDVPKCNQRAQDIGSTCDAGSCPAGTQLLTTTQFILVPFQLCPAGGHINWCCSQSKSLSNTLGQCTWTDCGGSCPSGSTELTQTLTGDGGDAPCTSGRRKLCCPTSGGSGFIPSTCGWYRNAFHNTCTPGCPEGKVQLAVDSAGANCVRGSGSFCCDPPVNTLAGRSDPSVLSFQSFVHLFLTQGTCSAHNIGKRSTTKRQWSSFLAPSSHDVAIKLGPMLFDWEFLNSERKYIEPFQKVWDDEVRADGNRFPTFDTLATDLAEKKPASRNAIDYIDDTLCGSIARGSFDPVVCSLKSCSGSSCPLKRAMASVPDDIANQNFDTSDVRIGLDFTHPENGHIDPAAWWQQAKCLDWWQGSNHGVDSTFPTIEVASSAFVSFDQNPGENLITGAGPVWGCTIVAVVTNFGAWTAHFWQGFFSDETLFQQQVLDFLEYGNFFENYPGLHQHITSGGAFDVAREGFKFLSVTIMTPQAFEMELPDPFSRPVAVPGFGPMYQDKVTRIQNKLDEIFGVQEGSLNIDLYTYGSDQTIWNWVAQESILPNGLYDVHWSWVLDRSPRLVDNPYTGMMTIQRRATNVPGLAPAVRIWCEDNLRLNQEW